MNHWEVIKQKVEKENSNMNSETTENEKIGEELDRILKENPEAEKAEEESQKPENEAAEKHQREYDELNERYLRLYADFENYKKRSVKEKADSLIYACAPLMEKLLSVKDNMERALGSGEENSPLFEGLKLVAKQFGDILEGEGLQAIETENKPFDPNYHNAVMLDNDEEKEDNVITAELQKGYTFKDKVIRPSMVKVNKKN